MQKSSQPSHNTNSSYDPKRSRSEDIKNDPRSEGAHSAIPDPKRKLIESGDVLSLLAWFRSRSVLNLPPAAMDDLATAIRNLERRDVDGLVEVAYTEIIGLTTLLLIRYQLHIEKRLAESDPSGVSTHMPHDLISEDWIGRVERTTRFLMEITTTRERVRHVARLNADAIRKDPYQLNGHPMGSGSRQARNGQAVPHQSRFSDQENGFKFP